MAAFGTLSPGEEALEPANPLAGFLANVAKAVAWDLPHNAIRNAAIPPGLRREDFTDIPANTAPDPRSAWGGVGVPFGRIGWQPGDPLIGNTLEAAMNVMGGTALSAPAGAAGAGPTLRRVADATLDLSPEARLARATEQGFDTSRPVYHGTSKDKDFTKFKDSRHGTWTTTNPTEASGYAMNNDSKGYVIDHAARGFAMKPVNSADRVIPLYAKPLENPYNVMEQGWPESVSRASNYKKAQSEFFDQLKRAGHDGVIMPGGPDGSGIRVDFNNANLRGQFAPFDPKNAGKPVIFGAGAARREAAAPAAVEAGLEAALPPAARVAPATADNLTGMVQDAAGATNSLNPLDNVPVVFKGKEPHQFSPEDWQEFGKAHGVENMGPLSPPQHFRDSAGNDFWLPGGTEGKWTYADLLYMKANPINPENVDRALHTQMQQKLGRTMTPEGGATDADVWNGLVFGMTSPNNPLFPNQISASRMRLRSPEMIDDLAAMVPWKLGDNPSPAQRKEVGDKIAAAFGLQAAGKGGLGTRGSADYSRIGDLALMWKKDPSFFHKKADETWDQAVERISSQVPGLSMKTGSFGTVWQDPANAAISAIDRHMARELEKKGGLFDGPKERAAWEAQSVKRWNDRTETIDGVKVKVNANDQAADFNDLLTKGGADGFIGEMLLDHVGDAKTPKFRLAKGNVNPDIPEHLKSAKWVNEPETVFKMGAAYRRALQENQKLADESGLNLFMSQWMEWDRIRRRFEPHENMFPGLSKLPAPSIEQLRRVDTAHKETGHKTYGKDDTGSLQPTKRHKGLPSELGYLGVGGAAALPVFGSMRPREQ